MPAERVPPFFRGWATNYPIGGSALSPHYLRSEQVVLTARARPPHDRKWMDPDALAPLPAGRAATLIADGTLSPVDLLEACLARAGAAVEDVKLPAPFAACREMIARFAGVPASSRPSGVRGGLAVAAWCERVLDFTLSPSM